MNKQIESRSLRARGLKHKLDMQKSRERLVALFTGAWIETMSESFSWYSSYRRALYGRVD